jgi:hypothetical protein
MSAAATFSPIVLPAHSQWLNTWSLVSLGIGTPPQWLDVLPATVGSEFWAVTPAGCPDNITALMPNCSVTRGNVFYANESTTLVADTTDVIPDSEFFFPSVGNYSFDTVTLNISNSSSSNGTSLLEVGTQTVAQFSGNPFWYGMMGLGQRPVALNGNEQHPTVLTSLKNASQIPSLSYGYTAGAYYENAPANLVLGGYDEAAFTPSNISFEINESSGDRALTLSLQSIEVVNTLQGTATITGAGGNDISVAVDSMLPAMWLPQVCLVLDRVLETLEWLIDCPRKSATPSPQPSDSTTTTKPATTSLTAPTLYKT